MLPLFQAPGSTWQPCSFSIQTSDTAINVDHEDWVLDPNKTLSENRISKWYIRYVPSDKMRMYNCNIALHIDKVHYCTSYHCTLHILQKMKLRYPTSTGKTTRDTRPIPRCCGDGYPVNQTSNKLLVFHCARPIFFCHFPTLTIYCTIFSHM